MKKTSKKIAGAVAGGVLVVTASPFSAALAEEVAVEPSADIFGQNAASAVVSTEKSVEQQVIKDIQGSFTWNQGVVLENSALSRLLYQASKYHCDSQGPESALVNEQGVITHIMVSGDVENVYSASIEELVKVAPIKKIMACTCASNTANGIASANVLISGFKLSALIEQAGPIQGVNTITFVSSDGYRVSFPLSYVLQRYSVIVTDVNDEAATEAIGCSNQLWLGATSARSFIRDIVAIEITQEETPPPVPTLAEAANQPNVGVTQGEA